MDRISFDKKIDEICNEIKKLDNFAIIGHYDADGISSTAIIAIALKRLGKKFQTLSVKQLYSDTVKEIKKMGENFIFVDFGSGQLDYLEEEFEDGKFFVLDHHNPKESNYRFHLNPILFGFNGNNELSGAGVCYFVARALDEKNKDLSYLALVGAVGDMQDGRGELIGLNREILKDGTKAKVLKVEKDLRLYGRISRPLTQFLMFANNPIIPELTANDENCKKFLINLGLGSQGESYSDLSFEKKQIFTTNIILQLQKFNTPEWKLRELIGEVYTLLNENEKSPLRDAKEFATLLNSCGRHGKAEIGLQVCMGDRDFYYSKALSLLAEHRKQLREGIEFVTGKGVDEEEFFYFFDAGERIKDSLVGIIAGMLYGSVLEGNKPIFAFSKSDEEFYKVSGRATKDLIRRGVNLSKIIKEACNELGDKSEGGGHAIAAGARIREYQKEEFLKKMSEKLKLVLKN